MKLKRLLATALVFALVLTLGAASVAADPSQYNDLPAQGSWNYDAIVSAIENNVFSGENGYIKPGEYITVGQMYTYTGNALGVQLDTPTNSTATATREDMFVLLAEVVGAELASNDKVEDYLGGFSDNASISSSARTPIAALIKAGYINGVKSGLTASLYPKNQLSRSEYAVLAHRVFGTYINSGGTVSNEMKNVTVRASGVNLTGIISGDLIIGGSTGTNSVNLNGATVRGRTIVRGDASITASSRSTIGIVHNYADLTFSGDATTINVRGEGSNIKLNGGWLRNLNLESDKNVVTVSTGTEIAFCSIDGSDNAVSGSGTFGSVIVGGSNNKFESAADNVSDTGRNNITNTKTGTFNITGVEITSNTQIVVTFDAKIQTAPASAFTLSGNAKSYTKNSTATPDSTSISGTKVTLTFSGATFLSMSGYTNTATITVTDAVISSEKAKLNTKSFTGGYDDYYYGYYDPTVSWQSNSSVGSGTSYYSTNGRTITYTAKADGTSKQIAFSTYGWLAKSSSSSGSNGYMDIYQDWNSSTWRNSSSGWGYGGYNYGGTYGYGTFYDSTDKKTYQVKGYNSSGYLYYDNDAGVRKTFNESNTNWSGYGYYGSGYGYYNTGYLAFNAPTTVGSSYTFYVTSYADYGYNNSSSSYNYTIIVNFN